VFGGDFGNGKKRNERKNYYFFYKKYKKRPRIFFPLLLPLSLVPWLHFRAWSKLNNRKKTSIFQLEVVKTHYLKTQSFLN
jgi:hypothetical protein